MVITMHCQVVYAQTFISRMTHTDNATNFSIVSAVQTFLIAALLAFTGVTNAHRQQHAFVLTAAKGSNQA